MRKTLLGMLVQSYFTMTPLAILMIAMYFIIKGEYTKLLTLLTIGGIYYIGPICLFTIISRMVNPKKKR